MMIPADSQAASPQELVDVLDKELNTLVYVMEMLDVEHEALIGSDAERLEQAVAAKQNAINAHLKARHDREAIGLKDALREQIEAHPTLVNGLKARAIEIVHDLEKLALKSKELNTRNGRLISGLQDRTTSAIRVLRPEAANITLYGDSGSAENTMGSRLLGSA